MKAAKSTLVYSFENQLFKQPTIKHSSLTTNK